jgi:hypothetical protein
VAYRSWLNDIKVIQDLGDHCQALTFRKPEDEKREIKYEEKWRARTQQNIPVADESKFAFGSRMHDSWVEWIKRSRGEFRLRINNDLAHHFVYELSEMLEIAQPDDFEAWVAPVDLVFEDPVYVNAVREYPGGKLRWTEWENLGRRNQDKPEQFLRDWFFEQDGRLQWIAELWRTRVNDLSNKLYLLVDCSIARAEDGRAQAIRDILGLPAEQIWTDLVNGVDQGDDWHGWSAVYAYIEKRMAARGIQANDFKLNLNRI